MLQEIALVSMVLLNRVKRVGNNIKGTADPDISFMDVMAADLYTSIKKSGYKGEKRNVVLASAVQQSESAICIHISPPWEFPGSSVGKESACSARDLASIPGLGRSPGQGNGNPLRYSCLENPMDRGAWRAMVHSVARSQTPLKRLSTHTHTHAHIHTSLHM